MTGLDLARAQYTMKAAAIDIVVMGSGMFSSVKAMKHAGELARKYATTHKAPG